MEITSASYAAPGRPNEDYVIAGPNWVVLLDGATHRPGVDSGCVHDVPWLVAHLGGELAYSLAVEPKVELAAALAEAITSLVEAHAHSCDLTNPDSPSSTVALLREQRDGALDYLLLGDSQLFLDTGRGAGGPAGRLKRISDDRTSNLPSYTAEAVRSFRNRAGGFWVASTNPAAAYEAVTGSAPAGDVARATLLTDGVTRYVERLGMGSWASLLHHLWFDGPAPVVAQIRRAEVAQLPERSVEPGTGRDLKRHDDATAVLCLLDEVPAPSPDESEVAHG